MEVSDIRQGEWRVIRVDGTEESMLGKPSIPKIHKALGVEALDSVTLRRTPPIVMMVDDTGMVDGKPINPKATELYHSICKPGTPYSIHGDVAIVNDEDFA